MVNRSHILLVEYPLPYPRTAVPLPNNELVAFQIKTGFLWLFEEAVKIVYRQSDLWRPSRQG